MLSKDQSLKAVLKRIDHAEVVISKSYNANGCKAFYLYENGAYISKLEIESHSENSKNFVYQVKGFPELKLGKEYQIFDERNIPISLDCSCLCQYDKYIDRMYYDGEMGAIYSKEKTTFRIFSPLASQVIVSIVYHDKPYICLPLFKNDATGVWENSILGDYDGYNYTYIMKINNEYHEAIDPYAKSVNKFSRSAYIINPEKVYVEKDHSHLDDFNSITDAIIYEMSVRDITSDKNMNFINKGKYIGLLEKNIKTRNGNPAGIDYIKDLGVTHVQLQPVFDFCTTNDEHPEDTYNWGYDPSNYNVPEGSYSSNPNDPYSRIIELKNVIQEFHKAGIRVVLDVVYNHVFNMECSCFEAACPNYYFRFDENGNKSNGSFCGNDFESRHLMARKYIVDSCKYWVEEFDVDGFRFDLMGIIDINTMNEIEEVCHKIKNDFIIYGEGWDMPTLMPGNQRASMNNASLLPNIGFFNDRFRDITKGKTGFDELYLKGYLTGDCNYIDGFKHVFAGSTLPLAFPPLFNTPKQSINYVECHDNNTLYDKLKVCCPDEDETYLLKRIKLINACILLSNGVPFFHMGQEIGLSKKGEHNSYNLPDEINQFEWKILDDRIDLYKFFRQVIALRKTYSFLRYETKEQIEKSIVFSNAENGGLCIRYIDLESIAPYKDVRIYINPNKEAINVDLDDYYQVILNETGTFTTPLYAQHLTINGISVVMVIKN